MADIGPRDELYMVDPEGKMEKMEPNTHHLEYLMDFYPDEEDYNQDFWDTIFEGGWIRIELRENHRNGWDLALNGNSLYRMKAIVRDKFLERLGRGENKVHIEQWTGSGFNPTHIFYLPAQKRELFDFVFEKLQAKFISEALDFERGRDPRDSMEIGDPILRLVQKLVVPGFFSQKKRDVEANIENVINEILKHPSWDGDLSSVTNISLDKWSDGSFVIEVEHPWSWGSRGKEIKKVLRYIGINPIGKIDTFTRGDYKYYQIPIEPLPIKESYNFERGLDPKIALGLDLYQNMVEKIKEITFTTDAQDYKWEYNSKTKQMKLFVEDFSWTNLREFVNIIRKLEKDYPNAIKVGWYIPPENTTKNPNTLGVMPYKPRFCFIKLKKFTKIDESANFERGINPKEAMTIGTEAQKKKLDKETDWGFEFSHAFQVKTFDVIEYEGFLIKTVQVMGSDGIAYYATLNNTGEPYNNTPPLYDTPEEALDWEQKYIDQYNMGL